MSEPIVLGSDRYETEIDDLREMLESIFEAAKHSEAALYNVVKHAEKAYQERHADR